MSVTVEVVEGWTGDIEFVLNADGVAVNLTGMTVELVLKDKAGTTITTTGDVTVFDAANGKVRYNPDSTDLVNSGSPLTGRFKVTDSGGKVVFFPNGQADRWRVFSP